jgi:hypothetical protein
MAKYNEYLDKLFAKHKLIKVAEGSYCDSGDKDNYARMLRVGMILKDQEWFIRCDERWDWYNGEIHEAWAV